MLLKMSDEDSKFRRLLNSVVLSRDTIDKLGFVGAGWLTHTADGSYKVTPLMIIRIYKVTYRGCMKMSNDNIIISCSAAVISIILSLCPWYDCRNYFIFLTQVFIQFAHMSIKEFNEIIQIVDDAVSIKNVSEYMFE